MENFTLWYSQDARKKYRRQNARCKVGECNPRDVRQHPAPSPEEGNQEKQRKLRNNILLNAIKIVSAQAEKRIIIWQATQINHRK
jgi:hypothetical protein